MSATGPDPNPPEVHIERLLPAPVGEVFAAWTDPALMARWLSPRGRAEVEADVRVGGALRVAMISNDVRIDHTGEYLEVDPPRRLAFTWRSIHTSEAVTIVTVTLSPRGRDTHLTLRHTRLPSDAVASHRGGWETIVDRLAALVEPQPSPHLQGDHARGR